MNERKPLPAGLAYHCERCRVVIPADAPRPDAEEIAGHNELQCEWVARHRLAWFNELASPRLQHVMASAAWELVYHFRLRGENPHAGSLEYLHRFKMCPAEHWKQSEASARMRSGRELEDLVAVYLADGFKVRDIARDLGCSPNEVREAIVRIREAFFGPRLPPKVTTT